MKNIDFKKNYFKIFISVLVITIIIIIYSLVNFTWKKVDLSIYPSKFPTYDITKINEISGILTLRQDINTQGKPNMDKFNFGNTEPF